MDKIILIASLVFLAACGAPRENHDYNLPQLSAASLDTRPLIIGHRGDSMVTPENTLPSFRSAMSVKADMVELDYHHSLDEVPVVIHDKGLDRTTDIEVVNPGGSIFVKDYSADL